MFRARIRRLAFGLWLCGCFHYGAAQSFRLTGQTAIVLSADEPEPVQHAAEDLSADFEKVFGRRARIVRPGSDLGDTAVVIGERNKLPQELRSAGTNNAPESFFITARNLSRTPHKIEAVLLEGPDVRGAMYAVYEFSHRYLGVDPLYFWTDNQPRHHASIAIPESLNQQYSPPVFRYRGFFINDEDLLTGWAPAPKDEQTGISLQIWNKIYETTLRLKGNMVAPGTWIFPDDGQVKLAAKRGLIIAQHHAIPLGVNVARWPDGVPYNYSAHPEILPRAWRNAVQEYSRDQEVLWSVGLRGLSDVSYASMDPSVRGDNKALAQLITKAIADQIQIVRAARPDASFVTNLWQEGARLRQQGLLVIPPDVHTVWADDGWGHLQDNGQVASGQGIYDHIAMMNGRANQLTEMVPISRSFSEMDRYIKANATYYYLVNTSDLRPVTMSTRAVMDVAWKGLPKASDPVAEFYRDWSVEEFGEQAAASLTQLYQAYFNAAARVDDPVHEYGDQYYHVTARSMLLSFMTDAPLYALPEQAPLWEPPRVLLSAYKGYHPIGKDWLRETVAKELQRCGEAQPRWDAEWTKAVDLEPSIPVARRPFYQAQVLTMVAIGRESNRMLSEIAKAIRDAELKQTLQAHRDVKEALDALDNIQREETTAEYGKWRHWYRGDWLTGIYRTRQLVEILDRFLDDPQTHLPPPVLWDGWEAYYHIMHYEGTRSVDVH